MHRAALLCLLSLLVACSGSGGSSGGGSGSTGGGAGSSGGGSGSSGGGSSSSGGGTGGSGGGGGQCHGTVTGTNGTTNATLKCERVTWLKGTNNQGGITPTSLQVTPSRIQLPVIGFNPVTGDAMVGTSTAGYGFSVVDGNQSWVAGDATQPGQVAQGTGSITITAVDAPISPVGSSLVEWPIHGTITGHLVPIVGTTGNVDVSLSF